MTARDDKPTAPQLSLDLSAFSPDEIELIAGIVSAVRLGQHVVALPGQRVTLHRIELKLQARKRTGGEGGA